MDKYYKLHDQIIELMKAKRFREVSRAVEQTIPLYKDLVTKTKREYGVFDLQTSVAIEKGGKIVAALGMIDILHKLESTLRSIPEIQSWAEEAARLVEDSDIGNRIIQLVREIPGISQLKLKDKLHIDDQKRISNVVYWLEKVGRTKREKEGKSYKLF
jgi:hypothetical protein